MKYYRRKIDKVLDSWFNSDAKMPALVTGIRQCGKTEAIRNFAIRNNLQLIEMNFWYHPEYCSDFKDNLNVDNIISNIALRFPKYLIDKNKTLIFLDEIQDCPLARLSLKSFKEDGRYFVIASGSYLGINGYIKSDSTPIPTGSEEVFEMKTMDFEEFLWANGYTDSQIEGLIEHFEKKIPIEENVHHLFNNLYLKYACVGGFPKAVATFVESHNIIDSFKVVNNILLEMKADFGRRKDKNGNPIFNKSEVSRIQNVFDLIPTFLAKENKRYIVSKIKGGNQYDKNDSIEYLRQAHIVNKVYNVSIPSIPLKGEIIESQFKLFPEDIGIVTSMYGVETLRAIINGNLGQGKGAIYESLVFDSLNKAGIKVYYFAKESGLEIDFVIEYCEFPTLIEAKAKNGNTKSSKTVMKHPEHYGHVKLLKIGDCNISEENDTTTIPHYLVFALGHIKDSFK